jgi:hypothetical protein
VGWVAWKVAPVYISHYSFNDKVEEICRTPAYKIRQPEQINEMLLKAVREAQMDEWITRQSFVVTSNETRRTIKLYYEREVEILPGWKYLFKFDSVADQPLI